MAKSIAAQDFDRNTADFRKSMISFRHSELQGALMVRHEHGGRDGRLPRSLLCENIIIFV